MEDLPQKKNFVHLGILLLLLVGLGVGVSLATKQEPINFRSRAQERHVPVIDRIIRKPTPTSIPTPTSLVKTGVINIIESPYNGNIQSAIDDALKLGVGRVYVPAGTYKISGLVINRNQPQDQQHGLELFGDGIDTQLIYEGDGNALAISDPQQATPGGFEIHHMKIKSTNSNVKSGIILNPGGSGPSPEGVDLHHLWIDCSGGQQSTGVRVTRAGYGLKVHDNTVDDCFDGVVLGGLSNYIEVRNNYILLFRRYGISAGGDVNEWAIGGLEIVHNRFEETRAWGTLENPAVAIRLAYVTMADVSNNRIEHTPGNPLTGIKLDVNARRNRIAWNTIHVNAPYAIDVDALADRNELWNNERGDPMAPYRILNNGTVLREIKTDTIPWVSK